jgi:hypothetical protein
MWKILPVESTCLPALGSEVEAVSGFRPVQFRQSLVPHKPIKNPPYFPSTLTPPLAGRRDAKALRESEAIVHMQTCWLRGLPYERDVAKELSS